MKTSRKIITGFLATLTMTAALAFYADFTSRRSLEQAVGHELLTLAQTTMQRIDLAIYDKIMFIRNITEQEWMLSRIADSNQTLAAMDSSEDFMNRMEGEWVSTPAGAPSSFMLEIEDNELSRALRQQFLNFFLIKRGYSPFSKILVTNRHGALIATTERSTNYRHDRQAWWRETRQQGILFEDIAYHAGSDSYGITVSLRLDDGAGNFLGIIRAIIDAGPIIRNAEITTNRYHSTRTRLLTRKGNTIYRTKPYRFLEDSDPTLFNRLAGVEGFFIGGYDTERQRFYSYARSQGQGRYPGFGWILLVSYDTAEVLATAHTVRTRIIWVSIILIMTGTLFALLLSRTIIRSLAALSAGAEKIGQGEFNCRIELAGNDEFSKLAATFNGMVRNLQETTASRDELNIQIAERTKVERALRESENRFRATFEQAAVGIALVSPDGDWLRVNRKLCAIVGYPESRLLQRTFQDITHPDDLNSDLELVNKVLHGEISTYSLQKRYICMDGEPKWINLTVSLVRDENNSPSYFIAIVEDIDQRKKTEQERDRLAGELARKNHELEQIIYVTSHDLRSPLVNVQGFSKELSKDVQQLLSIWRSMDIPEKINRQAEPLLSEDIPESLQFIEKSVGKMDALLNGLLRLSRLGRASLTLEKCDMNKLLADIITTMDYQIKHSGAEVQVEELPACQGDSAQLNQLFSNLLDNALKYLSPSRPGKISLSGSKHNGMCLYRVSDNGIGIAREHQERIFEIFHRLNPEAGDGEGLGLTIVSRIVERLNGTIRVESEEDKGSSFYVTLPEPLNETKTD